jgi:hypothetical protein
VACHDSVTSLSLPLSLTRSTDAPEKDSFGPAIRFLHHPTVSTSSTLIKIHRESENPPCCSKPSPANQPPFPKGRLPLWPSERTRGSSVYLVWFRVTIITVGHSSSSIQAGIETLIGNALCYALPRIVDARPPIIQGPGAKPGTVPTDLEQSTGIERYEILARMEGHDPFDRKPLAVNHMGTLDNPVKVFSLVRPPPPPQIVLHHT